MIVSLQTKNMVHIKELKGYLLGTLTSCEVTEKYTLREKIEYKECGKIVRDKFILRTHMHSHTGEKPCQ